MRTTLIAVLALVFMSGAVYAEDLSEPADTLDAPAADTAITATSLTEAAESDTAASDTSLLATTPPPVKTTPGATMLYAASSETVTTTTVEPGFWEHVGDGVAHGGKASWNGIKKGSVWVWGGMVKGGKAVKHSTVSTYNKMTGSSEEELESYDQMISDANKMLTESKTRRELRKQKFEQDLRKMQSDTAVPVTQ